ncbi:hypothetical protein [Bradyrhizobium sp. RDI18]|uniref:hypothetical protein n=1 Tax=Bradyrhizobium sp. RDI18 TaxID=3367400 RepID=UPI00371FC206
MDEALFHLPAGFIKNIDAGLGFPKGYRSILDSIEEIDGVKAWSSQAKFALLEPVSTKLNHLGISFGQFRRRIVAAAESARREDLGLLHSILLSHQEFQRWRWSPVLGHVDQKRQQCHLHLQQLQRSGYLLSGPYTCEVQHGAMGHVLPGLLQV